MFLSDRNINIITKKGLSTPNIDAPKFICRMHQMRAGKDIENLKEMVRNQEKDPEEKIIKRNLNEMWMLPRKKAFIAYDKDKDKTIAEILLEVLENYGFLCDNWGQDNSLHRQYFYHKDGYIECKISERTSYHNDEDNVYVSAFCKECHLTIQDKEEANSGTLEYSFGLFLKHYFYNRELTNKPNLRIKWCHSILDIQRMFEFGNLTITFEYFPVEKYSIDLYDYRKSSCHSNSYTLDKLMESLIIDFLEVYTSLDALLSVIKINEANESKPHITKAKSCLKKVIKNFKVVIFDTLKNERIREIIFIFSIFKYAFINSISIVFLIKEFYNLCYSSVEKELSEEERQNILKGKAKLSILSSVKDTKPGKFDRAMALFNHVFNNTKTVRVVDNKEMKDDKYPVNFFEDLSSKVNTKEAQFKNINSQFSRCFKELDEGCMFTPSGINNIDIRVNPENIGSLIAFCLSSNIYFDGLVYFNYLNLKNKFLIQRDTINIKKFEQMQEVYLNNEDETDVFNGQVPASHIGKYIVL